jgi:hypothetical protein
LKKEPSKQGFENLKQWFEETTVQIKTRSKSSFLKAVFLQD